MNLKNFLFVIGFSIVFGSCSSTKTQTSDPTNPTNNSSERPNDFVGPGEFGGGERMNELLAELNLDEAQKEQFIEINQKYRKKLQELRSSNMGDRMAMMEGIRAVRNERNAELKEVLTTEQYKVYKEKIAEMRQGMGNRRSN